MKKYDQYVKEVKGTSFITSVPIKDFESIQDLQNFIETMDKNGLGTSIKVEHSNFYQGVLIQTYDKETCSDSCRKELLKGYKKSKENTRWIPVEEKTPCSGQCILVVFEGDKGPDLGVYEVDGLGNGAFYPKDLPDPYVEYDMFVKAWMPLPKYNKEDA